MKDKPNKKKFELGENESIADVLDRMKEEGYSPVRRIEEPIFQEVKENGKTEIIPVGRSIVFEGKLL
ncbi:NETI motif-containing protein [Bacillus sp. FJAT-42376]|uniref:NETI motif-containing protein n=1 Tax=Bacillus sp. FJAT-42376 TaxID=2014076 RepID=UPI000F5132FE|nr:NETI motif-containing protein [Bacillus sp. FJAT-42376]AZB41458.1 NETI motif-containing protein [Bacillus sp. FJAT-42376]